MGAGKLKVAVCQFAVSDCMELNAARIRTFTEEAAAEGANVIHFPEGALSGYRLHKSCSSHEDFDWARLRAETEYIQEWARKNRIAIVLGSCHYLNASDKPTNCLYIISRTGRIVERYDKHMLFKREQDVHTAGTRLVTVTLNGIRCGFLVCYDSCFPPLFEEYKRMGVELMFVSLHNADNNGGACPIDSLLEAQFRVRAADYGMWICVSNSSARHCRLPACIVKPDGSVRSLRRHNSGLLYHEFPDDILGWTYDNRLPRTNRGNILHLGVTSKDPRATDPHALP
ncbi:MAG: carbon-nitrogen hydrolase family protein [FCB group bacterium]|jgi:predicted amidohydrolase|nr:carbon-nitrogen hydrolase family protein [FCB group bacterium]